VKHKRTSHPKYKMTASKLKVAASDQMHCVPAGISCSNGSMSEMLWASSMTSSTLPHPSIPYIMQTALQRGLYAVRGRMLVALPCSKVNICHPSNRTRNILVHVPSDYPSARKKNAFNAPSATDFAAEPFKRHQC
jgi:hypothetical protein